MVRRSREGVWTGRRRPRRCRVDAFAESFSDGLQGFLNHGDRPVSGQNPTATARTDHSGGTLDSVRRSVAAAGSAAFFAVAPGVVAGLVPWALTRWRPGAAFAHWLPARVSGIVLLVAGA